MTSIIALGNGWQNLDIFTPKMQFLINFDVMRQLESNSRANLLQKR